jgi:hypothetical protein
MGGLLMKRGTVRNSVLVAGAFVVFVAILLIASIVQQVEIRRLRSQLATQQERIVVLEQYAPQKTWGATGSMPPEVIEKISSIPPSGMPFIYAKPAEGGFAKGSIPSQPSNKPD